MVLPPPGDPLKSSRWPGTQRDSEGQEWGNGVGKLTLGPTGAESEREPQHGGGEAMTPLPFPPRRTQPWFLQITRCLSERALLPSAAQPLGVVGQGGVCARGDPKDPKHSGTDVPPPPPPRCATDHNSDNTTAMLQEWLQAVGSNYHSVAWKAEEGPRCGQGGDNPVLRPPPCTSPLCAQGVFAGLFACVLLPAQLGADSGRRHAVCALSLCVPSPHC